MVLMEHKTKSDSESDTEASGVLSDEEVDDIEDQRDEVLPEPPDPLDPQSNSDTSSTPEPPDSDEDSFTSSAQAAGDELDVHSPHLKSSVIHLGVTNILNVSFLLDRYGKRQNSSLSHASITSDHITKFTSEIPQPPGAVNGSYAGAKTPADNWMPMEDNRRTDGETIATENSSDLCQTSDQKEESDNSTKEKSNGVSEKEQLAVENSAAAARATLFSSHDLTDCELSDVPDARLSPDYDHIPTERNKMVHPPSEFTDCQWTRHFLEEIHPVVGESDAKEPNDASDGQGEAAALPSSSLGTYSRNVCIDEDRYFALDTDVAAPVLPTTSTAEDDIPSPNTERRRIKDENRQRSQNHRSHGVHARTAEWFIQVPTEKIGRVVGKGGRQIKEIENKSGAKIKIEDRKSKKPLTKITLTGTEEQIWAANMEINVITRNFKSGEPVQPTTTTNEVELKQVLLDIKKQVFDGEKDCR